MTTKTPEVLAIWAETYNPLNGRFIIGNRDSDSGLPWDTIPEDLAHFREATRDRLLVMGHNTFKHLPASMTTPESLVERPIAVLTSQVDTIYDNEYLVEGLDFYDPSTWGDAVGGYQAQLNALSFLADGKDIAIIGGAGVIELFEPTLDRILVTFVDSANCTGGDIDAPNLNWDNLTTVKRTELRTGTVIPAHTPFDPSYPYVLESTHRRPAITEPTA